MSYDLSPVGDDGLISADEFRREGNFVGAVLGGIIGAALGAGLWAVIGVVTDSQIGWIAILIGLFAGFGVRLLGKGKTIPYKLIGAVLAFVGVVAGNIITVYIVLYNDPQFGPDFVSRLAINHYIELLTSSIEPVDLLFYGLALFSGFAFAVPNEQKPKTGSPKSQVNS